MKTQKEVIELAQKIRDILIKELDSNTNDIINVTSTLFGSVFVSLHKQIGKSADELFETIINEIKKVYLEETK